jgi:2'-5' RNA ligase
MGDSQVRESALLIAVPEADALAGDMRALDDPSASAGVPAHVTILYPFVSAEAIDDAVIDSVRGVLSRHEAFEFSLRTVERFDEGTGVPRPEPA